MTKKDIELIEKAKQLSSIDWSFATLYIEDADTEEAKKILHDISTRLHHKEEYSIRML